MVFSMKQNDHIQLKIADTSLKQKENLVDGK